MEVPRYWRLKKQYYRLVGENCPHCQEKIFPPRDICPRCSNNTFIYPKTQENIDKYWKERGMSTPQNTESIRVDIKEE